VLDTAARARRKLIDAGLVDKPERSAADELQRRLTSLEAVLPRLEPHPRLGDVLHDYALRARSVVERLRDLAEESLPPAVPADSPCLRHGARRDSRGICRDCRRPDLSHSARVGIAA
jgi:hypothetical protein